MNKVIVAIVSLIAFSHLSSSFFCQNQIDFRGMGSTYVDFRLSPRLSLQGMMCGFMFNDFTELGVAFMDGGIKYRFNKTIGVNGNYRFLLKRNFNNFYDNRHIFYIDLDFSKNIQRYTFGGTCRAQTEFYDRIVNTTRMPLVYNRTKVNMKYRLNYFLHPFTEIEIFYPLNHPVRKNIDQFRFALGSAYVLNKNIKIESYLQIRQQLHRSVNYSVFLIATNFFFSF
jgi:hypothetical protein